ncbi:hypothetical protein ACFW9N_17645 [Streptomyces sp. NPDC059496]|uniref:HflX-like GTP-binding protein n=1 Tax=Streptomyces sp. NPDC059496 TaxID=3346851 RepID=UPI0036880876
MATRFGELAIRFEATVLIAVIHEWLRPCSPCSVAEKSGIAAGSRGFSLRDMHQPRRRDRRLTRRVSSEPARRQAFRLPEEGADVVLVGYFSAKQKDFETLMASAATELAAHGARVVAQMVQRRGVSDGGVRKMGLPFSSRTLLTYGKVREVALACEQANADAVIFVASLTERQQRTLTDMLGRPAVSLPDILTAD